MRTKLFWQALTKFVIGLLTVCLLLFLPAGTFHYWRGWLLLALLFIPMFIAGIILLLKNPDLLDLAMVYMQKYCGRTYIFPERWRFRRIRKSLIQDCMELSGTPCI